MCPVWKWGLNLGRVECSNEQGLTKKHLYTSGVLRNFPISAYQMSDKGLPATGHTARTDCNSFVNYSS